MFATSAFWPVADIVSCTAFHVRYWHLADISTGLSKSAFGGKADIEYNGLPPLIVEEIGWAGKATIAGGVVRTVIGRPRRLGALSRAARIVKLVWLAGAAYAADCGHTLLQSLETAIGCATPTAAIRCAPRIGVVRRRLCG